MRTAKQSTGRTKQRSSRRIAVALAVLGGALAGVLGTTTPSASADGMVTPAMARYRLDECGLKPIKATVLGRTDYWDCTFVDNFTTGTLDTTKWTVQKTSISDFSLGGECVVDSPNNISFVDDPAIASTTDHLRLTARREAAEFTCVSNKPANNFQATHTGATLMTYNKFTQAYGRFEVRAKLPNITVPGAQFSFWLFRQDLQAAGEIDPMEWYSQYSDRGIPMLHGSAAPYTNHYCTFDTTKGPWHTYTLEWTPRSIKVLYDGVTCLHNTNVGPNAPAPFNTPMMVNLTLGLDPTHPDANGALPSSWNVDIDYVKVWS